MKLFPNAFSFGNKVKIEDLELLRYETPIRVMTSNGCSPMFFLSDVESLSVNDKNENHSLVFQMGVEWEAADISRFEGQLYIPMRGNPSIEQVFDRLQAIIQAGPNKHVYNKIKTKDGMTVVKRRIVCGATKFNKDLVVPCIRHFDMVQRDILNRVYDIGGNKMLNLDTKEGFLDQFGQFWSRSKALTIALANEQVSKKHGNNRELFTEDLY